ncbi:type VII secretion-associated serine protease mycosin, partial [Streptomyces sp. TRM76130]|nr:type VII secretion-associated serine protease mycosin [Streptomyces sp. TRM76130]
PELTPAQVKSLLEDTAANAPADGRDDSRGYGFIDPAAAIEAAGRLTPRSLEPAGYGEEYFGAGPDDETVTGSASAWVAPLAGGAGGVLLVAAVVLWRGRPTRYDDC